MEQVISAAGMPYQRLELSSVRDWPIIQYSGAEHRVIAERFGAQIRLEPRVAGETCGLKPIGGNAVDRPSSFARGRFFSQGKNET